MGDFEFNCPHCDQSLEVPDDMLGSMIDCPACEGQISLPDPEPEIDVEPIVDTPILDTKACPFCGETILTSAQKCKHCGEFLNPSVRKAMATPSPTTTRSGEPICQQCRGGMKKTVISSGNCGGIVLALIVFVLGCILFWSVPVVGWILGPIISLGALFMGGKRRKVWKCQKCGSVVDRA